MNKCHSNPGVRQGRTWNEPGFQVHSFLGQGKDRTGSQTQVQLSNPHCAVLSSSVMSDCLWPHGLQPARLLCPWDSPGKNTGVGCHALLQGIFPSQGLNPGLQHYRQILLPTEPPGKPKNTGVGGLSLLQGIFPTQESNWCLLHCRWFFTSWATREAPYLHWEHSNSILKTSSEV